jgi:competence protein ComEC
VLLGSCLALYSIGPLFFIFAILLLIFPLFTFDYKAAHLRILLALTLGIGSFYFTSVRYQFPKDPSIKTGIAEIEIASVRLSKTPFGLIWNYRATLKSFVHNGQHIIKDIPVLVTHVISPLKNEPWHPKKEQHNFVEWRFSAKSAVQKYIGESIQDIHVRAFLSGIATGEFDDRLLTFELGRFGLQHLMAISGLHFSILSGLLMLAFGLIFPRNRAAIITIVIMSAYFLFLGASASVTRAWIALMIGLLSCFIERRNSGFNALGIGALMIVLWDPLAVEEIGFQFSFGITAAILLWFAPCEAYLQSIFAKRKLSEATKMDSWDRHGYCLLYFLRQGLALSLAVNLVALPLTLYHFHSFPLMGLVYNLFFPFLMSFSLVLLAFACPLSMIFPWLGNLLHSLNESYTSFVLNFAFNLPRTFDISWQVDMIPKEGIMIYLLLILSLGLVLNRKRQTPQSIFHHRDHRAHRGGKSSLIDFFHHRDHRAHRGGQRSQRGVLMLKSC